ncbi:hypothetical protein DSO57_1006914 [Entomophthora muscae]|uniref:Uncharacterized protein n=1 Tax=Entomophthora muscae TaxID=34485 RepID=A0ACC2U580_9FUNG|nr:hypothetical protein DSO57_1006914 [Entomophthora muscae]
MGSGPTFLSGPTLLSTMFESLSLPHCFPGLLLRLWPPPRCPDVSSSPPFPLSPFCPLPCFSPTLFRGALIVPLVAFFLVIPLVNSSLSSSSSPSPSNSGAPLFHFSLPFAPSVRSLASPGLVTLLSCPVSPAFLLWCLPSLSFLLPVLSSSFVLGLAAVFCCLCVPFSLLVSFPLSLFLVPPLVSPFCSLSNFSLSPPGVFYHSFVFSIWCFLMFLINRLFSTELPLFSLSRSGDHFLLLFPSWVGPHYPLPSLLSSLAPSSPGFPACFFGRRGVIRIRFFYCVRL